MSQWAKCPNTPICILLKSLVIMDVSLKIKQLKLAMSKLESDDGHYFSTSIWKFLKTTTKKKN